MTTRRDPEALLAAYLADGMEVLPDRVVDAILDEAHRTRQRTAFGAWRTVSMFKIALGAAAITAVMAIGGAAWLGAFRTDGLVGGPPISPSPSSEASAAPSTSPSPKRTDPEGELAPGTYAAHPLPEPNDSLTVSFVVPDGWQYVSSFLAPVGEPGVGPPGGTSLQFIDVDSLNSDPCDWSGEGDDLSVGPTVADLVAALREQTAYEVSEPLDVTIGGHSGKRVEIIQPTAPFVDQGADAPGCDNNGRFRFWNTTALGHLDPIYAQGPASRWQTNVLDVDGTRLVVIAIDFPGTSPADRAEMDAIIDSLVIAP